MRNAQQKFNALLTLVIGKKSRPRNQKIYYQSQEKILKIPHLCSLCCGCQHELVKNRDNLMVEQFVSEPGCELVCLVWARWYGCWRPPYPMSTSSACASVSLRPYHQNPSKLLFHNHPSTHSIGHNNCYSKTCLN